MSFKKKWELSNIGGIQMENTFDNTRPTGFSLIVDNADSQENNDFVKTVSNTEDYTNIRPLASPDSRLDELDELQSIRQNIVEIQETNNKMLKELHRLKAKHIMSEAKIEENMDYIYFLEREVARLDQYGRRENIEMIGIPNSVKDGDLEVNVLRILHQIGLPRIQHYNIAACHRLNTKDRFGNKNTIVRFINLKDSISCLKNKKNLQFCRELGFHHIYITENLCPSNRSIFDHLNNLKKNGELKRVWSYNGTVQFKFTDDPNEKSKKILHECDLNYYFEDGKKYLRK